MTGYSHQPDWEKLNPFKASILDYVTEDTEHNRSNTREMFYNLFLSETVDQKIFVDKELGARDDLKEKYRDTEPQRAKLRLYNVLKSRGLHDKIGLLNLDQSLGIIADVICDVYQQKRRVVTLARPVSQTLFLLSEYGTEENSKDTL